MLTICEYTLDQQEISMPKGARILCVQEQKGTPKLWVAADLTKDSVVRTFVVIQTGREFPAGLSTYIGTFQSVDGNLVYHVVELKV